MNVPKAALLLAAASALAACGQPQEPPEAAAGPAVPETAETSAAVPEIESNPNRNPYFGDLHVHTVYSFDAFLFGTRATPDDAYAFARGGALNHAAGFEMKMKKPLDFQAVTDHATYLGMLPAMFDEATELSQRPIAAELRAARTPAELGAAFAGLLPRIGGTLAEPDDLLDLDVVASAWSKIVESAERHNAPGEFTTFIGYEYTTSGPEFENLHRNVIFRGSKAPDMPFSRLDSLNPEDLWDWLDSQRDQGFEALAIPHNSNGSDGWMFELTNQAGEPIDAAYAEQRMRNEPLVEVTQVKGTSDTHPLLSPNDEWADFEIMPVRVASPLPSQPQGSYVREAWLNGLAMEEAQGLNPYRFGVIGSSDTHNAAGSLEEDNYWSKTGLLDATPQMRGSVPLDEGATADSVFALGGDDNAVGPGDAPSGEQAAGSGPTYANAFAQYWGASGLAGVWAESNTRKAIYDAFRRKEAFATSGPHIPVRFFAGYGIDEALLEAEDVIAAAYAAGVPMGGNLIADGDAAPGFFVWAMRDSDAAPLQRLQVIKGWVADGQANERVFDVACSDRGAVDPETHRCPDNGAAVDLTTCAISDDKGAAELSALWQDPTFTPGQRAFYYARVLENPKCRWSTWDAVRAGVAPREDLHATIQDRAWSSPIWYLP
ncbi:MAG: DUF3604 domain-containing protein [Gammaproteobacteria bacterium]|nr:DUF3604 domain-containing protein [Gammaproteobacteria bacterium]